MPKVLFKPGDDEVDCANGDRLFDVARGRQLKIQTACIGQGTCGLCRVRILAGEEHLSPYTDVEEKHLGNVYFLTKTRLSCQCRILGGPVTVELLP